MGVATPTGLAYREIDIEQDPEAAEFVLAHNDGRLRIPTLEFGGKVLGNPPLAQLVGRLGLE